MDRNLVLGAVAYDPKVVTIWEGFKNWFGRQGLAFDYVLYSNYERQVEAHLEGHFDVAWNSPLAWVRTRRMAAARGVGVQALAMRDTDCDLTSVIVARADGPLHDLGGLAGKTVATGAVDSPQATLLPLGRLREAGLEPGRDVRVRAHNVMVGKHGDHVGGEADAARALASGEVDAACLLEANYLQFDSDGTLPRGATRVLSRTESFDHCNATVTDAAPTELVERFSQLLLGMSYDDPEVRPLLELEGLKVWVPGRVQGYGQLEAAVDTAGFYAPDGTITAADYRP